MAAVPVCYWLKVTRDLEEEELGEVEEFREEAPESLIFELRSTQTSGPLRRFPPVGRLPVEASDWTNGFE